MNPTEEKEFAEMQRLGIVGAMTDDFRDAKSMVRALAKIGTQVDVVDMLDAWTYYSIELYCAGWLHWDRSAGEAKDALIAWESGGRPRYHDGRAT